VQTNAGQVGVAIGAASAAACRVHRSQPTSTAAGGSGSSSRATRILARQPVPNPTSCRTRSRTGYSSSTADAMHSGSTPASAQAAAPRQYAGTGMGRTAHSTVRLAAPCALAGGSSLYWHHQGRRRNRALLLSAMLSTHHSVQQSRSLTPSLDSRSFSPNESQARWSSSHPNQMGSMPSAPRRAPLLIRSPQVATICVSGGGWQQERAGFRAACQDACAGHRPRVCADPSAL
jgi:hypothetical protein